eukprot:2691479-Pyramimonas_sp.AAC.1
MTRYRRHVRMFEEAHLRHNKHAAIGRQLSGLGPHMRFSSATPSRSSMGGPSGGARWSSKRPFQTAALRELAESGWASAASYSCIFFRADGRSLSMIGPELSGARRAMAPLSRMLTSTAG